MTQTKLITFTQLQAFLGGENLQTHASEIHGFLTGILAAGYAFDNTDYLKTLEDMFNNGEALSKAMERQMKVLFAEIVQAIVDENFGFQLLLPDDDESIIERGQALNAWVQGFNLGFGLLQKQNSSYSEDVQEIIRDFADIANLSNELEDDEETEEAYFEILEYIRISSLLCFAELGDKPTANQTSKTLH
ncbi:UPF0149 family protein [Thalassotalea mangrovi]|uniref:UPF0149 family protein n=1 Tax=Thalassotalea mangrovi TaxID=2572245 RepID=A0A4U1BC17_9GAMM|nr:UPF0149 family protein [Thalassotalea mangrovi]TKB47710.1 UPF0149 family protein [Thalassotalea mangrovi]